MFHPATSSLQAVNIILVDFAYFLLLAFLRNTYEWLTAPVFLMAANLMGPITLMAANFKVHAVYFFSIDNFNEKLLENDFWIKN